MSERPDVLVIGLACVGLVLMTRTRLTASRRCGHAESDVDAFLSYVERRMVRLANEQRRST